MSTAIDSDARVNALEDGWAAGRPPRLEDLVADLPPGPDRRALLAELLPIDLEHRWKRRAAGDTLPPPLEDYLTRFPELADGGPPFDAELVADEFAYRRRYGGATPDPAEYRRRFPDLWPQLRPLLELPDPPPRWGSAAGSVPGYETLGKLGQGGMGVVWKARQVGLERVVALKMLPPDAFTGDAELDRFRAEAAATARLQHPNIVTVYEVGEAGGAPFFSMELCPGGSLADRLRGGPLPAGEAARLVAALARAAAAAHAAGVVHRDLKPGNVLFAADGTPKLADFGLAKRLDTTLHTQTGAVLGTPAYMAPEQADGRARAVGPAADVYALGAILYECLTGQPPFPGGSVVEVLLRVRTEDPPRLSSVRPGVPRDLETVALKCLEKEPARRYASAAALADDLRRYLDRRPVLARPVGAAGRLGRWCRRNPVTAFLLGAVAVSLIAGTVTATAFALQARANAKQAEANAAEESRQRLRAEQEEGKARAAAALAEQRLEQNRRAQQRDGLAFADQFLRQRLVEQARSALALVPPDRRGWEWWHLKRLLDSAPRPVTVVGGHDSLFSSVTAAALSPDGHTVASAGLDGRVVLWRADGYGPVRELWRGRLWEERNCWLPARVARRFVREAAAGPDCVVSLCWLDGGAALAGGSADGQGVVWNLRPGGPGERVVVRHDQPLFAVAASADGGHLLFGGADGALLLYDRARGATTRHQHGGAAVHALAALPAGGWAVGRADGAVQLLDRSADRASARAAVRPPVWGLAVPAAGDWLAVACGAPRLYRYDLASRPGDLVLSEWYRPADDAAEDLGRCFHAVSVTPDGHRIFAGDDRGQLMVWDVRRASSLWAVQDQGGETLKTGLRNRLAGPLGRAVAALAPAPDGRTVYSAGADTSIKRWEQRDTARTAFPLPPGAVIAFDRDDPGLLWAAAADGSLGLYDSHTGRQLAAAPAHAGRATGLAYAAQARRVVTGGADGRIQVWRRRGEAIERDGPPLAVGRPVRDVSVSADGRRVAAYLRSDAACPGFAAAVVGLLGSPAGHGPLLAAGALTPERTCERVGAWDVAGWRAVLDDALGEGDTPPATRGLAALNAAGTELVVCGPLQSFIVISLGSAGEPDSIGNQVAGGGGTALVWHPTHPEVVISGDTLGRLRSYRGPGDFSGRGAATQGLAVSPDGARLAAVSRNGELAVFDWAGGEPLLTLSPDHDAFPTQAAFDPTGTRLAVVHADGAVTIREAPTPLPAPPAPPARRDWSSRTLLHQPGGTDLLVYMDRGTALDRSGRVGLLFSRPAADNAAGRQHNPRIAFLGRETADGGFDEQPLGPVVGGDLTAALAAAGDDLLAAVRRGIQGYNGTTVLHRWPAGAARPAADPEPLIGVGNKGFYLHLVPAPSGRPHAFHFDYSGDYLCGTSWPGGTERTVRLGRAGTGGLLRAAAGPDGRVHLVYRPSGGAAPHPWAYVMASGGPHWTATEPEVIDPGCWLQVFGLAVNREGWPAVLVMEPTEDGEASTCAVLERGPGGWVRSPVAAAGRVTGVSNLACDAQGRLAFAFFLGTDGSALCLATGRGGAWEVERVASWPGPSAGAPLPPGVSSLVLRLDARDRPVLVITDTAGGAGSRVTVHRPG